MKSFVSSLVEGIADLVVGKASSLAAESAVGSGGTSCSNSVDCVVCRWCGVVCVGVCGGSDHDCDADFVYVC